MAGKVRYLIERGGRFHARIVVPAKLRKIMGKVELSAPLGADRREALRRLPAVVAEFQDRIAAAGRRLRNETGEQSQSARPRRLEASEMARIHYLESVAFDTELRNTDPRYAAFGYIDDDRVSELRAVAAGLAEDSACNRALYFTLKKFRDRGNSGYEEGTPEWRAWTRQLAQAELASLNVTAYRNEGYEDPPTPIAYETQETTDTRPSSDPRIRDVFAGYRAELQTAGKGRDADRRWQPIIEGLIKHLNHDRANRVTRRDIVRWKEKLLESFAAKTVRDFYLSTTRSAFNWALDNDLIASNPFVGIRVRVPVVIVSRERGFNDEEALKVLLAARDYHAPSPREQPRMIAAKRWTPFLAAYSGARIAELTQLRKEDIREQGGVNFIRITPDAGTVKTRQYRDVPLHDHLRELGFLDFVRASDVGPLFYRAGTGEDRVRSSRVVADRLAKWIRSLNIVDPIVQPNHGWRHRFKTQGRELGLDPRVVDAIQGHAARTAGESYGDVTLKAKTAAIGKFPSYETS